MKSRYILIVPLLLCCSCEKPQTKPKSKAVLVYGVLQPQFIEHPKAIVVKPQSKVKTKQKTVVASRAVERVKRFEGFSNMRYKCPAGVDTIGYGFTGKTARRSWISRAESDRILQKELAECQRIVKKNVRVKLTDAQLWALTSFTYNCGEGSLRKLVNGKGRLNSGNYRSIPRLLPLYCKGDGTVLRGLVKRRSWECSLWNMKS